MAKPIRRHALLAPLFAALFALSLVAAQITTVMDPNLSFFSPWSRAWESLTGSLLALAVRQRPAQDEPSWVDWVMPKFAIVVLAASMIWVDLPKVSHPGLVTVPAVLATAALLWWARPGEAVTRLLSFRPTVYIGKLSYSLYLWHFPIFAFGRINSLHPLNLADIVLWTALVFVGAALSYHFVERPARFDLSGKVFSGALIGALAALAGFVATATLTDMVPGMRAPQLARIYDGRDIDNERLRLESWGPLNAPLIDAGATNALHEAGSGGGDALTLRNSDALRVLIVGNSHSKDVFIALNSNQQHFEGMEFARYGISGQFAQEELSQMYMAPNFLAADVVIIAPRYTPKTIIGLPQLFENLRKFEKHTVLLDRTAEFYSPVFIPLYDWVLQDHDGKCRWQDLMSLLTNTAALPSCEAMQSCEK